MNADVLECENAFEAFCKWHSHEAHHHHHDNVKQKETIKFCGVNTHHQNGLAEKIICDLQEQVIMFLLDAKARWPQAINTSLWPYAMRTACYVSNILPSSGSIKSQLETFSEVAVSPSLKHTYTHLTDKFLLYILHWQQTIS